MTMTAPRAGTDEIAGRLHFHQVLALPRMATPERSRAKNTGITVDPDGARLDVGQTSSTVGQQHRDDLADGQAEALTRRAPPRDGVIWGGRRVEAAGGARPLA